MKKDYNCIVCDIDGVLLDTSFIIKDIYEKGLKGDRKWDYFYEECNSEKVNIYSDMKNYIELMVIQGALPILSTARNERNRENTIKKLNKEGIPFYELYMRGEDDYRPSSEVKKDHLISIRNKYNILLFMDDDISNVSMAESLGIKAIKIPRENIIWVEGERGYENSSN